MRTKLPWKSPRLALAALLIVVSGGAALTACAPGPGGGKIDVRLAAETDEFLKQYNTMFQSVYTPQGEAAWVASTDVTPEHDEERVRAGKVFAAAVGDEKVLQKTLKLLEKQDLLPSIQVRQLDRILLNAAESPGTIPEVVARRVELEGQQSSRLDSYQFCLQRDGEECRVPITANGIDNLLAESRDLEERRRVWEASKEIGPVLKEGLVELREVRNAVAREMGYSSFFALQVADYGMTVPEMMELLDRFLADMKPLYEQLHCWTKYTLAKRFEEPVPAGLIPAQWLNNRWAQSWPGIVDGVDLDPLFREETAAQIVRHAENFYVSIGFSELPPSFWKNSDLYPVPEGSSRLKNSHASAWDIDLTGDVRSLMSVEPNTRWFGTAHHELGHIYYYLSYDRPGVPLVLREGANRAFHEGIGELISMASMQIPYLREVGILPEGREIDGMRWLLNEALEETVPFLPWSAGVMSHWEHDLYEGELSPDEFNRRWWSYVERYQGVAPPATRGEENCDACTKTHVNDDPAQYYDYAIATVLKYQLHDHICRRILHQDVHACNYYGHKGVGDFLKSILETGRSRDWRELLREATGRDLTTQPMESYFRPLVEFLDEENRGRSCGWREEGA